MSSSFEISVAELRVRRRVTARANDAARALAQSARAAWAWADNVRQSVETRNGWGFDDARVLDDASYAAALDCCAALQSAADLAERAVQQLQAMPAMEPNIAPPGTAPNVERDPGREAGR